MRNTANHRFKLLLFFSILFSFSFLPVRHQSEQPPELPRYYLANMAYKQGKWQEALAGFQEVVQQNPRFFGQNRLLQFKRGYAQYQLRNFSGALDAWNNCSNMPAGLDEYPLYFRALAQLNIGDTLVAWNTLKQLRRKFPDSPIHPFTDSLMAKLFLAENQIDSSLYYSLRMLRSGKFDRGSLLLHILDFEARLSDTSNYRYHAFQFLRSYPFHNSSEHIYSVLKNSYHKKIPLPDFKKLIRYLFTSQQFMAAEKLIEEQQKYAIGINETDYFNWLPVEMAYRQGEYRRVLNWCLTQRKYFKSAPIIRKIDLTIPRCYLRLDQTKKSIKTYLQYQRRYPSNNISAEVLWKVGWLYEELDELSNANRTYRKLVKKYRRSAFRNEANFRIGLNYYRMAKYGKARKEWERALHQTRDRFQKDRIRYWIGKSYERQGNYRRQGEIFIDLAKRPVDSYYNLKAFFLTSNGSDTHTGYRETLWELHNQDQSYLPKYISRFRRPLLVNEILGARWSNCELEALKIDRKNWEEVFAEGELYERLGNYGKAFRKFRSIFNLHFADANVREMIPVFKKLYPLYFSAGIDSLKINYPVEPEVIRAVIKKESAFEPRIISYANAYGLMQLLPMTASQMAPKLQMRYTSTEQLFDPEVNIQMGAFYLSSLLKRYQRNKVMALAAYNAGPHRVDRWKKIYSTADDDLFMENLAFEQTRVYVRTCLKYYWVYQSLNNPDAIPDEINRYPVRLSELMQNQ